MFSRRLLKLRHMSTGEIRRRVNRARQVRHERRLYRAGENPFAAEFATSMPALCPDRLTKLFVPGSSACHLRRLRAEFPKDYAAVQSIVTERADAVLSGSLCLLGQTQDLCHPIDWHRDSSSGYLWPQKYYADISLYDVGETVDVKRVWELGRHQFLVSLAVSAALHQNDSPKIAERHAKLVREILLDWIDHNPLHMGIHWTSGLEVAMRLISWIWALALCGQTGTWRKDDLDRVACSLAEHALYLERHLSFDSSPYNHLIGEAAGLYLAGVALEPWTPASRLRHLGRHVLEDHSPRQFHEDGFTVEQAMSYHFFTLGFLAMAITTARAEGNPLVAVEQAVHKAFRASVPFRRPDGTWPAIGDLDSARSIPVVPSAFWNFDSLCHLAAVLFDDPTMKLNDDACGEELFWMIGCDGVAQFRQMERESQSHRATVLKSSGYAAALRSGESAATAEHLVFDVGPVSAGLHRDATPSTAHGHADTLSLHYHVNGKVLLRDSGMPYYYGPRGWVDHFRSPAAHNTLEVDGVSFVRPAGRLAWSHAIPEWTLAANLTEQAWIARGQVLWNHRVTIERSLLALPGKGLLVADVIESDRPRGVCWHWQPPAAGKGEGHSSPAVRWSDPDNDTLLGIWCDENEIQTEYTDASSDSPVGWHASDYGSMTPAASLTVRIQPQRRILLCTFLGQAPIAFKVSTRGLTVKGNIEGNGDVNLASPLLPDVAESSGNSALDGSDAIHWRVTTSDFAGEFLAGSQLDPDSTEWQALNGEGGWPAYRRTTPKSASVNQASYQKRHMNVGV